jgi:hypothetical protein
VTRQTALSNNALAVPEFDTPSIRVMYVFVVTLYSRLMVRFKPMPEPAPTRDCPFCLSNISAAATRCAFCTAEVEA